MGLPDNVVPEDAQGARVGLDEGGDGADEGGLAGAVGPEHGEDHTLLRGQLQPVERELLAESLDHTGGFDHVRHSEPFHSGCGPFVIAMTNRDPRM
jgi:hypothetical protein